MKYEAELHHPFHLKLSRGFRRVLVSLSRGLKSKVVQHHSLQGVHNGELSVVMETNLKLCSSITTYFVYCSAASEEGTVKLIIVVAVIGLIVALESGLYVI